MDVIGREALLQAFAEAWTARDLGGLMELMAQDCEFGASVGPEPGASFVGREQVRRGYKLFLGRPGGPVPETTMAPTLVNEAFAVTRWTSRWVGPDGAPVEVQACDVFEFEGDRIKRKDTYRKVGGELPPG